MNKRSALLVAALGFSITACPSKSEETLLDTQRSMETRIVESQDSVIVLETSQSFPSPNGKNSVSVSSRSDQDGNLSQAVVSSERGGRGLVAFYRLRVSMDFQWVNDDELIVRYPADLPSPRIDARNSSFGFGGRGRVIYKAVPPSEIEPLRWTRFYPSHD